MVCGIEQVVTPTYVIPVVTVSQMIIYMAVQILEPALAMHTFIPRHSKKIRKIFSHGLASKVSKMMYM